MESQQHTDFSKQEQTENFLLRPVVELQTWWSKLPAPIYHLIHIAAAQPVLYSTACKNRRVFSYLSPGFHIITPDLALRGSQASGTAGFSRVGACRRWFCRFRCFCFGWLFRLAWFLDCRPCGAARWFAGRRLSGWLSGVVRSGFCRVPGLCRFWCLAVVLPLGLHWVSVGSPVVRRFHSRVGCAGCHLPGLFWLALIC
jgi:hypothetical protein